LLDLAFECQVEHEEDHASGGPNTTRCIEISAFELPSHWVFMNTSGRFDFNVGNRAVNASPTPCWSVMS
jgi:hypothetical protein